MYSPVNSRRFIDDNRRCECECGGKIISFLTKKTIDDKNLHRYIAKCCRNFARVTDAEGKSALHMVSSIGRRQVAEWLIKHGALIDFKDQELGYTALHHAICYGYIDCAVLLIRYGADIEIINNDYLNPMQFIRKFPNYKEFSRRIRRQKKNFVPNYMPRNEKDIELLVWGTNKNYNLGNGKEEDVTYPQFIDYFKEHNIVSMAISSYHSLFLDDKHRIYSVGDGRGGRLGNGSQNTLTLPKEIEYIDGKKNCVVKISCSKNHSLILTKEGHVYSCGKNNHHQLGYQIQNNESTEFKMVPIKTKYAIWDIIAKEEHSLAVSHTSIHVWGTNNGQFGSCYANVKYLLHPQPLKLYIKNYASYISLVSSSNTAIACYIHGWPSKILLWHKNVTKLITFPCFNNAVISSLCLCERENEQMTTKKQNQQTEQSSTTSHDSYVEMLIKVENSIYIWNENTKETYTCIVKGKNLSFNKILFRNGEILLISDGDVYQGTVKKVHLTNNSLIHGKPELYNLKVFSSNSTCQNYINEISTKHAYNIELKNLLHFDRVNDIFCDDDFKSFGLLQEKSTKYYQVPEEKFIYQNFSFLLNDSSDFNDIHDVVIHFNKKEYHCHKYIIFIKSSGLKDIINKSNDNKNVYLDYKYLTSKMFELILKHIYEGYVLSEQDFHDITESLNSIDHSDYKIKENNINKEFFDSLYLLEQKNISVQAFLIFLDYAVEFELKNLVQSVKMYFKLFIGCPILASRNKIKLMLPNQNHDVINITLFPELYDITIICKNNLEIKAHKCILFSHSDYFRASINKFWNGKNVIKLETVRYKYMLKIIDFLYSRNVKKFRDQNYDETFLCELIIICDQFLIHDLHNVCEIILAEKMSVQKCGELLKFAYTYNCSELEKCCLNYICQNLRRVLFHRSLEVCENDNDVLKKINTHYRKLFKIPVLKPHSDAVDDSDLLKIVKDFNVELLCKKDCEQQAINSMNKLLLNDEKIKNLSISSDNDKSNSMDTKKNNEKHHLVTEKLQKIKRRRLNEEEPKTNPLECPVKCNNILINEIQETLDNDLNNTNDEFKILNNKDKIDENESVAMSKNRLHSDNFSQTDDTRIQKC